jgi:glutaredoxin
MHKRTRRYVLGLLLALAAGPAGAVKVVECIDADGNSSFRDKCPPGMTMKGEKRLLGVGGTDQGPSIEEIAAARPITVYSVPDCDACDLVRTRLDGRDLPYTEKNVQDNAELQEEMKAATGGLTVPAVVIGSKVLTGYSSDALDGALEAAGYGPPPP